MMVDPEVVDVVLAVGGVLRVGPPGTAAREAREIRDHNERVFRALVGALLVVEWSGSHTRTRRDACSYPRCAADAVRGRHEAECPVDAALTLAGLPDQEARDAGRARLRNPGSKP